MGNVVEHASAVGIEDADVIENDLKWLAVSAVTDTSKPCSAASGLVCCALCCSYWRDTVVCVCCWLLDYQYNSSGFMRTRA